MTVVSVAVFMCHMAYLMLGKIDTERHDIQVDLDYAIPFIKEFVIPYVLWYVFIIATFMCYLIHDHKDLVEIGIYDVIGLIICCLIFVIYPTEITFRPEVVDGNGLCSDLVRWIFSADRPYNVLPSAHCYEATAIFIGIMSSRIGHHIHFFSKLSVWLMNTWGVDENNLAIFASINAFNNITSCLTFVSDNRNFFIDNTI